MCISMVKTNSEVALKTDLIKKNTEDSSKRTFDTELWLQVLADQKPPIVLVWLIPSLNVSVPSKIAYYSAEPIPTLRLEVV